MDRSRDRWQCLSRNRIECFRSSPESCYLSISDVDDWHWRLLNCRQPIVEMNCGLNKVGLLRCSAFIVLLVRISKRHLLMFLSSVYNVMKTAVLMTSCWGGLVIPCCTLLYMTIRENHSSTWYAIIYRRDLKFRRNLQSFLFRRKHGLFSRSRNVIWKNNGNEYIPVSDIWIPVKKK
jgi:hypothetical protein